MFEGVSFDGGQTWTSRLIGSNDGLGDACCDPSLSFDAYGNLFLSFHLTAEERLPVALSIDGGRSFRLIANIARVGRRRPFRAVDQPTIIAAQNEVWLVANVGGSIAAFGARVSGLGRVGAFSASEMVPGSDNCSYGDVAIGPNGQVMQTCTIENGPGAGRIFVSVDPDGLGPAGFGAPVLVAVTSIGGFDFVPAQPDRSIDAEPGLAWDETGGAHRGRVYLVYTLASPHRPAEMDIYLRHSDDQGASWSAPARVNDDHAASSHFLPKISLDPTSGRLAVIWYDCRRDSGKGGSGDTDRVRNNDAQLWGTFTSDGQTFTPNIQISAGTSNSHRSANRLDYGDYTGLSFYAGVAHPAWADNSDSTGDNPDGTHHQLDLYTAAAPAP
jgi:hypothetical protein